MRTGRPHPQLSRRLAHSRSVSGAVMRTQGFGAQSPTVGPSGQLGKEQTRQCRGSLFSVWSWIRSNSQHASQRNVLSRC